MGQDQDAPLITLVTWPREGLTTTGGVPAGVEVRPIWTTSTMCVRELALKIYGSRERGTSFTILPELDLSPYRKFRLFFNMSVVMRWWIPIHGWVDNMDFYFFFCLSMVVVLIMLMWRNKKVNWTNWLERL